MLKTESYLKTFKNKDPSPEEKSEIVTATAITSPFIPEMKHEFEELKVEKAGHITEDGQFYEDGDDAPEPRTAEEESIAQKTAKEGGKLVAATAIGKLIEVGIGAILG